MGMSLSVDVFYGYDCDYEWEPRPIDYDAEDFDWDEEREEFDWEDELARKLGWVEVPYPTDLAAATDEEKSNSPEFQAWKTGLHEKWALLRETPVEIDSYGYEHNARCIRVKASGQAGYASSMALDALPPTDPQWDAQLAHFIELLEIVVPEGSKPGWHVCCSYG